jgi:putative DNA primase/helicase
MSNIFNFDNIAEDCLTVKTSNGKSKPQPERALPPPQQPKGPRVKDWGSGKERPVMLVKPSGAAIDRAIDEAWNGGAEKPVEPANGNGSASEAATLCVAGEQSHVAAGLGSNGADSVLAVGSEVPSQLQDELLPAALHHSVAGKAPLADAPGPRNGSDEKPWILGAKRVDEKEAKLIEKARYYKLTGIGQAQRFVAEHLGLIRYCYGRKCWYIWTGKLWQASRNGEIYKLAKKTAKRLFDVCKIIDDLDERKSYSQRANYLNTRGGLDEMLYLAQSEVAVDLNELDANPYIVNAQNGIVDLRTGELMPHDPAAMCSRILACDYDPNATSEFLDVFLEGFTGGDDEAAGYIQRAMGCAMFGDAVEKALFFLFGEPNSRKTTFSNLLLKVFGSYGEVAAPETWLIQKSAGGNRGDLVRLAGARLVCTSEFPDGSKFDEALLKKVTGRAPITYAAKYEAEVSFTCKFTLLFDANDCPRIRSGDNGLWFRMRRIPCLGVLPKDKQDVNFKEKLHAPEVLRAALAWTVRGCIEWQQHGLGSCEAVEASVEEYRTEMSTIEQFFEECVVFGPELRVSNKDLKAAYNAWQIRNRRERETDKALVAALKKHHCTDVNSSALGGRGWKGLALSE